MFLLLLSLLFSVVRNSQGAAIVDGVPLLLVVFVLLLVRRSGRCRLCRRPFLVWFLVVFVGVHGLGYEVFFRGSCVCACTQFHEHETLNLEFGRQEDAYLSVADPGSTDRTRKWVRKDQPITDGAPAFRFHRAQQDRRARQDIKSITIVFAIIFVATIRRIIVDINHHRQPSSPTRTSSPDRQDSSAVLLSASILWLLEWTIFKRAQWRTTTMLSLWRHLQLQIYCLGTKR